MNIYLPTDSPSENQLSQSSYDKQSKVYEYDEENLKNTSSTSEYKQDWTADSSLHISKSEYNEAISVFDVAAYILKKLGAMTTMKLQKLVYYCQAWSLVWDENPLFNEQIEAWANGPVIRELFAYHRGTFRISSVSIGNPDLLDDNQKETIDAVLEYYGDKPSQWLIDLTHMETPWKKARTGLPIGQRSNRIITLEDMAEYYSSLPSVD